MYMLINTTLRYVKGGYFASSRSRSQKDFSEPDTGSTNEPDGMIRLLCIGKSLHSLVLHCDVRAWLPEIV